MTGVIDSLLPNVDSILGLRDDLGVALKQVKFVTRTWSGAEPGDGEYKDSFKEMKPSPRVVEFKTDLRIREGGFVKAGDIMLKMISKASFSEKDLDGTSEDPRIEKFYEVGGVFYRVINVHEKHVVWSVLLRPIANKGGHGG